MFVPLLGTNIVVFFCFLVFIDVFVFICTLFLRRASVICEFFLFLVSPPLFFLSLFRVAFLNPHTHLILYFVEGTPTVYIYNLFGQGDTRRYTHTHTKELYI